MASRPGLLVSHKVPAPSLPPPNSQAPVITAEVRCHWPLGTSRDAVLKALHEAYVLAVDETHERFASNPDGVRRL